jgi:S1-C subfamily serine protease
MTVRTCPYRVVAADVQNVEAPQDHGFLGIRYVFRDGSAEIDSVLPGTPAESIGLQRGDHVLKIDGVSIRSGADLQERIYNSRPGAQPELTIERNAEVVVEHPTLTSWPVINY